VRRTIEQLYIIAGLLLVAIPVAVANDHPVANPPRFEEADLAIAIDGRLDEAVWQDAVVLERFVRLEPVAQGLPAHDTEVRLFHTQHAIYFGFECEVAEGELHVALTPRDDGPSGDHVTIVLDTFGDAQRAYSFQVSAAGSQVDARVVSGRGTDRSWDTTFDAEVEIGDDAYWVEVRIPFRDLRFPETADQHWGMQVSRWLWAEEEQAAWAFVGSNVQNDLAHYGNIELHEIESGSNLQILPSATFAWADDGSASSCDFDAEVGEFTLCDVEGLYGVGARYQLGSSLTLDAVFNPDFSQVEADPGRITLNQRFALYLSERRPFFLEGRDALEAPNELFYSRSIGRPIAGLKLTGSVAERTRIGLLVAHDIDAPDSVLDSNFNVPRNEDDEPLSDVTTAVVRIEQDIFDTSRIAATLIDREYTGEARGNSRVAGADAHLQFGDNWRFDGGLYGTAAEDFDNNELTDFGAGVEGQWSNDNWSFVATEVWLGRDFRDEAGFIARTGFHQLRTKIDYYYRSDDPFMRFISPGIQGNLLFDTVTGETIEGIANANTYWDFGDRTANFVQANHRFEDFEGQRFEMTAAEYAIWSSYWPELGPWIGIAIGDTILRDEDLWVDGRPVLGSQLDFNIGIDSRTTSALQMALTLEVRSLYSGFLDRELLTQRVLRFRATYLFSNAVNLRFISEHASPDEQLSFDLLLSYLPSPGTVFFLGYSDVEDLSDPSPLVQRALFAKLSYLWSL
jgi:hypothetical protein